MPDMVIQEDNEAKKINDIKTMDDVSLYAIKKIYADFLEANRSCGSLISENAYYKHELEKVKNENKALKEQQQKMMYDALVEKKALKEEIDNLKKKIKKGKK